MTEALPNVTLTVAIHNMKIADATITFVQEYKISAENFTRLVVKDHGRFIKGVLRETDTGEQRFGEAVVQRSAKQPVRVWFVEEVLRATCVKVEAEG